MSLNTEGKRIIELLGIAVFLLVWGTMLYYNFSRMGDLEIK